LEWKYLSDPEPVEEPIYRNKDGKRINEAEYHSMSGYDGAKQHGITTHAECKRMGKTFEAYGCHRYVTEQKHFPPHIRQGNFGSDKTTAQCLAEVNAYWEPVLQDMREQGDDHAANVRAAKDWWPDQQECQNYDNIRIGEVIHKPASRLQTILNKVEDGGSISDQDRATVLNDLVRVSNFPDNPYKQAYIEKSKYFFQLADGKIQLPKKIRLKLSCREFQAKLDELVRAERETVAAQAELKRSHGVITNGAKWDSLNQSRIDRLSDFKVYTDDAKAAGCIMKQG
jgi:hypothetical protein